MDRHRTPGRLSRDGGFASLQFVIAAALAMVMVVGLLQFVVYQYARGAVLAGLERGVRAASVAGVSAGECLSALADTFASTLGGSIGDSLEYECDTTDEVVTARAWGEFPVWIGAGSLEFELETSARREPAP